MIREEFDGGKYSVTFDEKGLRAFRYGEQAPWRDLTGDKLVLAMLQEVERLRVLERSSKRNPVTPTEAKQLEADKRLLKRIDGFGKNLSSTEKDMLESFLQRVGGGAELSDKQRKVAVRIDEARVN